MWFFIGLAIGGVVVYVFYDQINEAFSYFKD